MSRHLMFAGIVAAVPFAALAQTCNPPAKVRIDWVGSITGCRPGTDYPSCALGETIYFFAQPVKGNFQSCDRFTWTFGDKSPYSSQRNPLHVYVTIPRSPVTCSVANDNGGNEIAANISVQTVLPSIDEFKAVSGRVLLGSPVTLTWTTRNIAKIRIDPIGYEDTRASGTMTVRPQQNTMFRLTAYGASALASSNPVPVNVVSGRHRPAKHQ